MRWGASFNMNTAIYILVIVSFLWNWFSCRGNADELVYFPSHPLLRAVFVLWNLAVIFAMAFLAGGLLQITPVSVVFGGFYILLNTYSIWRRLKRRRLIMLADAKSTAN